MSIKDFHSKDCIFGEISFSLITGRSKCNDRSGQVEKKSQKVTGAAEKDEEMP